MILKIIATIALSIISGICYRAGGSGNYPRFIRPLGVMLCLILELLLLGFFNYVIIICAGLIYGLSTTYFKKNGTEAKWYNWLLVGLAFSISVLPIVIIYKLWSGFAIRTIVSSGLVVLWSESNGNVVWEECGRGIIPIATIPLLLIGS